MFRSNASRLSSVLLAASLVGLAAPLMGAGPEVKLGGIQFDPPGFGKLRVRWGSGRAPQRQPEIRRHDHMAPCELELSAFQSGSTVIVVARGANRESGYITRFEACDLNDRTPEVHLHNHRSHDHCAQAITRFEATGSFNSRRQITCLKVQVGHQCYDVRVVQAPCL
jgi:hypothetical protein